jgi:predicted nucleic acid-binding protein
MKDKVFVDTNILVYSRDGSDVAKHEVAKNHIDRLWELRLGRLSVQILSEYFVTVTRKLKPGMPTERAWADIDALSSWSPVAIDWQLTEMAYSIYETEGLSWWDSLVIAAANASNCPILLSEDLNANQSYGTTKVINPFEKPIFN